MTGDWLLAVGLAYSVYALTGSTLASAAALLSSFVPQVLVGSVAGVFVDRWDRKRTMVVTNLLLAVGLTPLLLVSGADWIWLVYAVLAVQSCVEVFFAPAEQAFLPSVVEDADLVAANGLNAQVRNLARLFGSGLGGVIAAAGGIRAIAVADAITFVLAALLVARIRTTGRAVVTSAEKASGDPEEATEVVRGRVAALADEWRDGLRTVTSNRVLMTLMMMLLITSTGEGIMGTLFAPFVRHVLHGSGQVYGVITGVQAIGGVVGGFLVAVVAERWSPVTMVWAGSIVFGLIDLAIFLYPLVWVNPWPAAVGMILVGLPGAPGGRRHDDALPAQHHRRAPRPGVQPGLARAGRQRGRRLARRRLPRRPDRHHADPRPAGRRVCRRGPAGAHPSGRAGDVPRLVAHALVAQPVEAPRLGRGQ